MKEDGADAAGGIDAAWFRRIVVKGVFFWVTFFYVTILLLVCLIQYINLVRSKYLDFSGEMFARFQLGKNQAIQVEMGSHLSLPLCHETGLRWC